MIRPAEEILKIQKSGDLFSRDAATRKQEYISLMKAYKEIGNVGSHISMLFQQAEEHASHGSWDASNMVFYKLKEGKTVSFRYLSSHITELGRMHISANHVLFQIGKGQFARQMRRQLLSLKFADSDMEKELSSTLPKLEASYETATGEHLLLIKKQPDEFLLRDITTSCGNIPQKQVAWIVSRLLSLCCFLSYNGMTHNGIHISSCFVSPARHKVMLCGGWWYCVKNGERLLGVQKDIYDLMPLRVKNDKTGNPETDLESVKALARRLLGSEIHQIPQPFYEFLQSAGSGDAMAEFNRWDTVLTQAYGPRNYINWPVTAQQIYQNKESEV